MSQLREYNRAFWSRQGLRVLIRWEIIKCGIVSGVFWTVMIIACSWLEHSGHGYLGATFVGLWVGFMAPALFFEFTVLADLGHYLAFGRVFFVPKLIEESKSQNPPRTRVRLRELTPVRRALATVAILAGMTSPLSCLTTWVLVVLVRLPQETHADDRVHVRPYFLRLRNNIEVRMMEGALDRFRYRHAA